MKSKNTTNRSLRKLFLIAIFFVGTFCSSWDRLSDLQPWLYMISNPSSRLELFDSINSVDWRKTNNVSECRITMHKFKKGEINEKVLKYVTYKFHPEGDVKEMIYDQGRKRVKTNLINAENQIIESIIVEDQDTLVRKLLEYDKNGRLIKISQKGGDSRYIEQITNYQYTDDGKVTEVMVHQTNKRYPEGGYEAYRQSNTYDDRGRVAEQQVCMRLATGAIVADQIELKVKELTPAQCGYRTVNYYDDGDEPVKADNYYPDYMAAAGHIPFEGPRNYYLWERNDAGQVTAFQSISYKTNEMVSKRITQYNSQGKIMKQETYNSLRLVSRIIQSFNEEKQYL